MDWIVNWIIKTVISVFHSFVVDQVEYKIETAILDYTEEINKQINDYLENDRNIKSLLDFVTSFIKVLLEKNV